MMRIKQNIAGRSIFNKMDIVSFETAKQLKEAGFPQPETGFPHIWYATSDFLGADGEVHGAVGTAISMLCYMAMPYVVPLGFNEKVEIGKGKYKEFFYAPSVTKLLEAMPGIRIVCDGPKQFAIEGDFVSEKSLSELLAKEWILRHDK